MLLLLTLLLLAMLLCPQTVMNAASEACGLFVRSVMPGLLPYMTVAQMLASRARRITPMVVILLGWGGGSPTGGRLLTLCPHLTERRRVSLAVCCATMSPMFLLGTIGSWLGSSGAGICVLIAVLTGGALTGAMAGRVPRRAQAAREAAPPEPLTLGQAVEQTARTLLMVCGTMALMRVFAALAAMVTARFAPWLTLPVTTLLEVTTGTAQIASLPLPLPLRTALVAGATGFGGMAVLMQNRAVWRRGLMSLPEQILWQAVHGGLSFLIALGMMGMG